MGKRIVTPRELLLVEVERWCGDHACNARTRLPLTKAEARDYAGFECARCERWNEDALTERDIPEWWGELKADPLEGLRPARGAGGGDGGDDAGGAVARMGDGRKGPGGPGRPAGVEGEGGDPF